MALGCRLVFRVQGLRFFRGWLCTSRSVLAVLIKSRRSIVSGVYQHVYYHRSMSLPMDNGFQCRSGTYFRWASRAGLRVHESETCWYRRTRFLFLSSYVDEVQKPYTLKNHETCLGSPAPQSCKSPPHQSPLRLRSLSQKPWTEKP